MKKLLSLILAAILLLSLAACGGTPEQTAEGSPEQTAEEAQEPSAEEDMEPDEEEAQEPDPTSAPRAKMPSTELSAGDGIQETVLVDEMDVKITATNLECSSRGMVLSILIENNSDKDLTILSGTMAYACNSVNGYMIDGGYLYAQVAAGKKSNETINFDASELSVYGIKEVADICMGFDIMGDSVLDSYLKTGPRQLKTSLADAYDYETDTYLATMADSDFSSAYGFTVDALSEEELYSQNDVRVLSTAFVTNRDGETSLFLEAENTGAEQVQLCVGDFSVNGLQIQQGTWTGEAVNPGCRRVMMLDFSSMMDSAYWPLLGLDRIGETAFSLMLTDMESEPITDDQILTVSIPGREAAFDRQGDEVYAENNIRIVSKGLVSDGSSYSNDIYAVFLVENSNPVDMDVGVVRDSLSVNDFMTDYSCYSRTLRPDSSAVLTIRFDGDSLEGNGISRPEDINTMELIFRILDGNYDTVDEPAVTVTYSR